MVFNGANSQGIFVRYPIDGASPFSRPCLDRQEARAALAMFAWIPLKRTALLGFFQGDLDCLVYAILGNSTDVISCLGPLPIGQILRGVQDGSAGDLKLEIFLRVHGVVCVLLLKRHGKALVHFAESDLEVVVIVQIHQITSLFCVLPTVSVKNSLGARRPLVVR